MMKRKDRVVWGRRYIYHGSTHDYVNLVRSKGVDIWQTITGLCTDVASQDIFRIAAWLFAIGWQVKSFKPESKVDFFFGWKCHCISLFLTFSSFSFSVRDLFQNRFLVRCVVTHLCWEMGLFTGANDVPAVKVFALQSSTSLARYTKNSKKLFRTDSWLTLCSILSKKGIAKFSSLRIPARFSPKLKCTVDTTIYQTQVGMFFKAYLGIWTTTNFQKQGWIETVGTIFTNDKHGFRRLRCQKLFSHEH